MGFSRQEPWSGLPFPPPGDLPHPGVKPASSALAGGFLTIWASREALGRADLLNCGLAGELETLGAGGDAPGWVFKLSLYLAPLR